MATFGWKDILSLLKKAQKMAYCFQNWSDFLWEKIFQVNSKNLLKFKAEGQEFAKYLRSLEPSIQTVKGQNNPSNRMLY